MRLLFIFLLAFGGSGLNAQNRPDTRFIQHLINRGDFEEALYLIDHSSISNDSTFFYKGWAHYSLKELSLSTNSFLQVSEQSHYYLQSRFFAGYNSTFLADYENSADIFLQIDAQTKPIQILKDFQLAGIDLLNARYEDAEQKWETIDQENPIIFQPLLNLQHITDDLKKHRTKSPVLAGVLSAIVPGSGKFYAGKKGEGIANFIASVGFGFMTWENYRKLGFKNVKTLAFGSIFVANYASTIYGSAKTVKIIENDYQTISQNQILFNLHIPLRNFFE